MMTLLTQKGISRTGFQFSVWMLLALGGQGLRAEKIKLEFLPECEVAGEIIALGDIAKIEASPEIRAALERVEVGKSANFGRTRYLSTSGLVKREMRAWAEGHDLQTGGAGRVKVTTLARVLSRDSVITLLKEFMHQHRPASGPELEFEIAAMPKEIHIPSGNYSTQWVRSTSGPLKGLEKLQLHILFQGKVQRKIPVNIFVRHFSDVYIAKERISRGQTIFPAQLEKVRRDVTKLPGVALSSLKQLEGSQSRQVIVPGRVLTNKLVSLKPLVKQGQQVRVLAVRNGITISLAGIARQDGVVGEMIRVKNLASHKLIKAVVLEDGNLELVSLLNNG